MRGNEHREGSSGWHLGSQCKQASAFSQGRIRTVDSHSRTPPPVPPPPPPLPLFEAKFSSVPLAQEDLTFKKIFGAFDAGVGKTIGRGGVRPTPSPSSPALNPTPPSSLPNIPAFVKRVCPAQAGRIARCACSLCTLCTKFVQDHTKVKPFFSGLNTLPQGGGGCLPAFFLKFWVPSAESPSPPPPVGVGQEWVGIFWEKHL